MQTSFKQMFFLSTNKNLPKMLDELRFYCIEEALKKFNGSRTEAANFLGVNRTTLVMQMKKFDSKKFLVRGC
jgi:DNA-binding NtrC family response regulator